MVLKNFITLNMWRATIAQWTHLCLPSCSPGFDPQAQYIFFKFLFELSWQKDENKQKEVGMPHLGRKNNWRELLFTWLVYKCIQRLWYYFPIGHCTFTKAWSLFLTYLVLHNIFKYWPIPASFVCFPPFLIPVLISTIQIEKSVDVVLGIRTRA